MGTTADAVLSRYPLNFNDVKAPEPLKNGFLKSARAAENQRGAITAAAPAVSGASARRSPRDVFSRRVDSIDGTIAPDHSVANGELSGLATTGGVFTRASPPILGYDVNSAGTTNVSRCVKSSKAPLTADAVSIHMLEEQGHPAPAVVVSVAVATAAAPVVAAIANPAVPAKTLGEQFLAGLRYVFCFCCKSK